jgi:hypothetical protein
MAFTVVACGVHVPVDFIVLTICFLETAYIVIMNVEITHITSPGIHVITHVVHYKPTEPPPFA